MASQALVQKGTDNSHGEHNYLFIVYAPRDVTRKPYTMCSVGVRLCQTKVTAVPHARYVTNKSTKLEQGCPHQEKLLYVRYIYQSLHHKIKITRKIMAAIGAYWRIIALTLMLRAALRYFSDSARREVDKCDMPAG